MRHKIRKSCSVVVITAVIHNVVLFHKVKQLITSLSRIPLIYKGTGIVIFKYILSCFHS